MYKNATDIIKQNYVDYSTYSMKAKSYPSVYDGLTEVRRRCLVGAYTDAPATSMVKLSTMAAYALCYHPHSSDGIAEVIVNMTSKYTCPFPFFDGRGNFGDLVNPASAPRYLECRLNNNARNLYFKLFDEAPKENYEVREEPLYLPTLFPAALLTSQFLIGNGTPNCLIPGLVYDDLKKFIINYISKGEKLVTSQNFVRLVDYEQIDEKNRDKSIQDLLNTGKGTIVYKPTVELSKDRMTITIKNLYVLANFDSLVERFKGDIQADKIDVRDESAEERIWVIEKVKNRVYDMEACAKIVKQKFTYKENYAMYFHDEEGRVKPYSLGEVIKLCYNKYKEAYKNKLTKEVDKLAEHKNVLLCLADMSEHTNIVTNNKVNNDKKVEMLQEYIGWDKTIINLCLSKPIHMLKKDEKALKDTENKIQDTFKKINNIDSVIVKELESL